MASITGPMKMPMKPNASTPPSTPRNTSRKGSLPAADEIGLQEIVDDENDGDAIEEQSDAPPDVSLHEEPDGGREERQARTQWDKAEEKRQQPEEDAPEMPAAKKPERGQRGLRQRRAENAVDDATRRAAGQIDQTLRTRADEALGRRRQMPTEEATVAIHEEGDEQAQGHFDTIPARGWPPSAVPSWSRR